VQLVVTGEHAGYNGVIPRHPFNPWKRRFGALELVGRVGQLFIDPKSFPMFADPTKSASYALEWGTGFNWYLLSVFKIAVDFERTTFHGGGGNRTGDRRPENALFARVQLSF
jgi:phosphate-selective porin OprO/OprP